MSIKSKLHAILSLSAASAALLQTVTSSNAGPTELSPTGDKAFNSELTSKSDQLILKPAHQDELLRMYAGHSSHRSHSSHSSHYSGSSSSAHASHASHYSGSTYVAPRTPGVPSGGYSAPSAPRPRPVVPAVPSNYGTQTNISNQTNATSLGTGIVQAGVDVNTLKKRAAQGMADAQYALGLRYLNGWDGLEKNVEKAKLLFELSALQDNPYAKDKVAELKAQVVPSPQELEKSQKK